MIDFHSAFQALTGNPPFPWQTALYQRFIADRPDNIPPSCNLPTGLGKTSVIAVWLIALAKHPDKMPRRLVYIVNRRTVVDQTTDEVEKYRFLLGGAGPIWPPALNDLAGRLAALSSDPKQGPLAVSTLRGQFADNREWSADPSRPAVICGTVDMIGSRLLFSGYGVGMKAKPLHAGFLGQDSLLVHDEAHLEPAFQTLLEAIRDEQARCKDFKPMKVMELTATSRGSVKPFDLTDEDKSNAVVNERITATKTIHLDPVKDPKKLAEQLAAKAMEFKDRNRAVLVFARTVDDVMRIRDKLPKGRVETLTGTMRGKERDGLVEKDSFKRFMPGGQSDAETTYLVCTSAGEVGVNISGDHLICDLSTFDSMAQRFGRVNRFGKRNDSEIHVVYPTEFEKDDFDQRRKKTLKLLNVLNGDGSPDALGKLDTEARQEAFAPTPVILPATDILFDAWALTTITGKLPGRPPVEPYLHGLPTDWQPPETHVAWRSEVEKLQPKYESEEEREQRQQVDRKALAKLAADLLEDFPLKPHELLQDRMTRVRAAIDDMADKHPDAPAWVVSEDGEVTVTTLHELTVTEKRDGKTVYKIDSRYGTILLPPSIGGLNEQGMLDPKSPTANDVSCEWYEDREQTTPRRARSDEENPPAGMRLVRRIALPGGSEEDEPEFWYWFARGGDDDASKTAREPIKWQHHTDDVKRNLVAMAEKLFPDDVDWQRALELAADWHDLGKMRVVWQRSIGNPEPKDWHAKSGKPKNGRVWKPLELTDYRHEFGSLLDVKKEPDFHKLTDDQKELVLQLIAAHHGRGRPHFPPDEAFDPEHPQQLADEMAAKVPQRFARLQRKYGRWGLAYLESLLRAADWAASAIPSAFAEGDQ